MPGRTLIERVCRGEAVERTPVWIMRQAGRYLPEYRELRSRVDFLTATKTPELAARITLQPLERFPLDAAILFADIMTPLEGMGVDLEFSPGPVIREPIRSEGRAKALRQLDPEADTGFVLDALRLVRSELPSDRALIAFAGAPFTLFCYMVEGGGSKDFMEARSFLHAEAVVARGILDLLATSMTRYLVAQARAGADVLMLFDSWVGMLGPRTFKDVLLPVLRRLVHDVKQQVDQPIIYFAHGGATLLDTVREVGADVIGVDWRVSLSDAARLVGADTPLQGNLDPAMLFAPRGELGRAIDQTLEAGFAARGHIFNLGHGIHRTTDPDRVSFLVDRVRESSTRLRDQPSPAVHEAVGR